VMAREKPEALYEIRQARVRGWKARVAKAEEARQAIESSFVRFFNLFDILVCPGAPRPSHDPVPIHSHLLISILVSHPLLILIPTDCRGRVCTRAPLCSEPHAAI